MLGVFFNYHLKIQREGSCYMCPTRPTGAHGSVDRAQLRRGAMLPRRALAVPTEEAHVEEPKKAWAKGLTISSCEL